MSGLHVISPAHFGHLAQARDDSGKPLYLTSKLRAHMTRVVSESAVSYAVYDGTGLAFVAGAYDGPDEMEIWFMVGPRFLANARGCIALGREFIAGLCPSSETVVSYIRKDQPSASRLGRLFGARSLGEDRDFAGIVLERWVYD